MIHSRDVAGRFYAHLSQAQLLYLFEHSALLVLILRGPPPQFRHNHVSILELVPIILLLLLALSSSRVCLYEHIKQCGDGGIWLGRADRSPA